MARGREPPGHSFTEQLHDGHARKGENSTQARLMNDVKCALTIFITCLQNTFLGPDYTTSHTVTLGKWVTGAPLHLKGIC